MKALRNIGLAIGAAILLATTVVHAQPASATKLYVLDCGTLAKINILKDGMPGAPVDKPSPCFLVVHPKGSLIWETGLSEAADHRPGGGRDGFIVTKSLRSQLDQIGYPPSKITYVALSHYHSDHAGNSNDFSGSTWLAQKDQRDAMFGPWPGVLKSPLPNMNEWYALKTAKTVIVDNKDYDVFGDGSVVLLYTPAATPGHQSLFVRLAKTGPIVISGDVYTQLSGHQLYLQLTGHKIAKPYSQVDLDRFKRVVGSERTSGYMDAMGKIEDVLQKTKAQLWVQHDMTMFKTFKRAPAYYE